MGSKCTHAKVEVGFGRKTQCQHCPFIKGSNPYEIPKGYSLERHRGLANTIADPNDPSANLALDPLPVMACHETEQSYCVGWMHNQAGEGNNLRLRIRLSQHRATGRSTKLTLRGEQHPTFQDTLPEPEENPGV